MAHRLANLVYDLLELSFMIFFTLIGAKLIVFGTFFIEIEEFLVALVIILHVFSTNLLVGYPLSNIFNTKKNLLSYYSLFSMAVILLMWLGAGFSFINYSKSNLSHRPVLLTLLNYLNVTKICMNCALLLTPQRMTSLSFYKDAVEQLFGGLAFNLLVLSAHLTIYFGLIVVFDVIKYRTGLKRQPKVERTHNIPRGLLAPRELIEETEYVSSQRPQLSVLHCEKTFNKKFTAVDDVSFGVDQGKLFTLLGPNGAGKTSLLDILCGITDRTGGEVLVEGQSLQKNRLKHVSFCLQKNYLWEYLTFEEHVKIIAGWRGISKETTRELLSEIDKGLDIGKNMRIKAIHLSGGNKRKLNTVLALLSAPRIYILDEPTAGMDPKSRRYISLIKIFLECFKDLQGKGKMFCGFDDSHSQRGRSRPILSRNYQTKSAS